VIGAGVIGLSTAIRAQEQGHNVTILAKCLPGDMSTEYTSPWAGAHHVSFADGDEKQHEMDQETFKVMWDMSEPGQPGEHCFLRLEQKEYYCCERSESNCLEAMPEFEHIPPESLPPDAKSGVKFKTLTIETPTYLPYLQSVFLSKGGKIYRATIQHINQVLEGVFSARPDAFIVCAGLGARSLGGIEDQGMYPGRGQVVTIQAPWVKNGRTMRHEDGSATYSIPRRSGEVILGGTMGIDDWFPFARSETTANILERCLKLCPELVPPELNEDREFGVEDLKKLIVREGCGFRPYRKGGLRLEYGIVDSPERKDVPIVLNYGHGGFGYQSSWGTARVAVQLLEEALRKTGKVQM
jgi:glycine/D-amino acid oxidase-like deaminating enzyme